MELTYQALAVNRLSTDSGVADVLLVEDDLSDAQTITQAFQQSGCTARIEHVTDSTEALDYISSAGFPSDKHTARAPRLILLDLRLHKIGGLRALQQLKTDERTKNIPIVVLTSSQVAIELVRSYNLAVNSFVLKPADQKQFEEAVAAIGRYWLLTNEPSPSVSAPAFAGR